MLRRYLVQVVSSVMLMSDPFGWLVADVLHLRPATAPLAAAPVRDVRVTGKLAGLLADDLVCESATLTTGVRTFFHSEIEPDGKTCVIVFKAVELSGTLELEVRGTAGDAILAGRTPVTGRRSVRSISWWPKTLFGRHAIDLGGVTLRDDVSPGTRAVTLEVSIDALNPFHGAECRDARLVVDGSSPPVTIGPITPGGAVLRVCSVTFRDVPIESSVAVRVTATQRGTDLHAAADLSAESEWWRSARNGVVRKSLRLRSGKIDLPSGSPDDPNRRPAPPADPGTPPEIPPVPCATHRQGDANCDGTVNALDCARALAEMDRGVVRTADFNRDGRVDQADVDICRANLGKGVLTGEIDDAEADTVDGDASAGTTASDTPCPLFEDGDINCDGTVDRQDVADAVKALMGLAGSIDVDINRDGVVNEADLAEIRADVEEWLAEQQP